MALLRRKKNREAPKQDSGSSGNSVAPLSMALLVAMVIAVIILKGVQWVQGVDEAQVAPSTVEDFLDQLAPDSDEIENILSRRLDYEPATVTETSLLARDGVPIQAIMAKPVGYGPFPGIVLVHDSPASRTDTDTFHGALAERLSESLNAVVLTVDWRDSIIGEHDLTDVLTALDWFKRGSEFDDQPVLIVGVGHGAYISLLAAQQYTSNLSGVAAINPITDLASLHQYLEEVSLGGGDTLLFSAGCRSAVDGQVCLSENSVLENIDQLDESVLLMHHADHTERPISQSEILAARLVSTKVQFVRVESEEAQEEVIAVEESADVEGEEGDSETNDTEGETTPAPAETVDVTLYSTKTNILQNPANDGFAEAYNELVAWAEKVIESDAVEEESDSTEATNVNEESVGIDEEASVDSPGGAAPVRIEAQ